MLVLTISGAHFGDFLCFFLNSTDFIGTLVEKNLCKNAWILVLILCWSIVLFLALVGGLAIAHKLLPFMCGESLPGCLGQLFGLFLLCFFDRNLAISGARFDDFWCSFWRFLVLVLTISGARFDDFWCSFWRFLVLVLAISGARFGDFWCSFSAGLLCFLQHSVTLG